MKRFRHALDSAFDDGSLELVTIDYFGQRRRFSKLAPPSPATPFEVRVQGLIDQARMDDWLLDLVAAAHERRPRNVELAAIASERGLTLSGPRIDNHTGLPLEALVQASAKFINITALLEGLAGLQGKVCHLDFPGDGGGTGFLVEKDLVVTNHHVIAPLIEGRIQPKDVLCRFDYKQTIDGVRLDAKGETSVRLAAEPWLVDSRPPSQFDITPTLGDAGPDELDYAVIRLADPVGELPIGGDTVDVEAQPRGWVTPPDPAPALAQGNQLFLLQHPAGDALQLSIGTVTGFSVPGNTRMRHTANSRHGSSGSPCFNSDLELVALHHAHDPAYPPQWNQAVPFELIRKIWTTS